MSLNLRRVEYRDLNARQKENFNFQKVSAVLADYGFVTLRLNDDWQGADFIAQHIDCKTFLKVQLKGRLAFYKKYAGKDIYIAFLHGGDLYLYPHDELLERVLAETRIGSTSSWLDKGGYSFPGLSPQLQGLLEAYRLTARAGLPDADHKSQESSPMTSAKRR